MRLFNHHFLRIIVVLLVTVFITNTVYADSMMVSASFNGIAVNTSAQAVSEFTEGHHCHEHASSDQHHSYQNDSDRNRGSEDVSIGQQSHDKSPSHGGCSHCNHCMACYSMMLYDQVNVASISSQPVLAITTDMLYLAPTNPQPNKPPIS